MEDGKKLLKRRREGDRFGAGQDSTPRREKKIRKKGGETSLERRKRGRFEGR